MGVYRCYLEPGSIVNRNTRGPGQNLITFNVIDVFFFVDSAIVVSAETFRSTFRDGTQTTE